MTYHQEPEMDIRDRMMIISSTALSVANQLKRAPYRSDEVRVLALVLAAMIDRENFDIAMRDFRILVEKSMDVKEALLDAKKM